jgi:N-methylhydantoinase B
MELTQKTDPVTFEVIRSALDSIVDDMALTIVRTAYSNVVRDNMDFSTGFCDRDGILIAQGLTIPLHLGSIPDAIESFLSHFGDTVAPGDVWIMNDPYSGGMHLPDLFVVKPVFAMAERLVGFAVTIAHHTDVGGRVAGSNASDSTEIYQEGLRLPPLQLYERGIENRSVFSILQANVRVPDKVLGDLRAQLAACNVAERRFLELVQEFQLDTIEEYVRQLLDYSERMAHAEILKIPDGVYHFTDHIDDDGVDDRPIPINVSLRVSGNKIVVDFEGTSPQVKGAINSTLSVTKSMVYAAVRCMLPSNIPNNAGLFRPIAVRAPIGSVVNPTLPAAVAARGLTAFRISDAVLGALAQAVPEKVNAAGEGGNTGITVGGYDAQRKPFIYVEFLCGAWGGRFSRDGVDGVTNIFSDLANNPVEVVESEHPLRIEAYELIPDSGGPGRYRGGMGVRKRIRFLEEEAVLQVRSDRMKFRPYGLLGGQPGGPTRNVLVVNGNLVEEKSKFTRVIYKNDVLDHRQAGGGGVGDPLERDPEAVLSDVRNGLVSVQAAEEDYGVVVDHNSWTIDEEATSSIRRSAHAKGLGSH